jgi:hypothetical protein
MMAELPLAQCEYKYIVPLGDFQIITRQVVKMKLPPINGENG